MLHEVSFQILIWNYDIIFMCNQFDHRRCFMHLTAKNYLKSVHTKYQLFHAKYCSKIILHVPSGKAESGDEIICSKF